MFVRRFLCLSGPRRGWLRGMGLVLLACQVDDRRLAPIDWTITENTEDGGSGSGQSGCDPSNAATCAATDAGANGLGWFTQGGGGATTVSSLSGGHASSSSYLTGTGVVSGGSLATDWQNPVAGANTVQAGAAQGPDACNDINQNGVADRDETLVKNPAFAVEADASFWEPEPGVSIVWVPSDACADPNSGSLNVTYQPLGSVKGWRSGAATQCIHARAGVNYLAAAQIYLPTLGSRGGVGLSFYPTPDCTGEMLSDSDSPLLMFNDVWVQTTVAAVAPDNTLSLSVRLNSGRTDWSVTKEQADIYVDDVSVIAQ